MSTDYGFWSQLSDAEKTASVVSQNPKNLEPARHKSSQAFRTTGQLQIEWQQSILPAIKARTDKDDFRYAINRGKPITDSILWSLYLVGDSPNIRALVPTIVSECADKKLAQRGCEQLQKMKKSGLSSLLQGFDIRFRQNVIRLRSEQGDGSIDLNSPQLPFASTMTLCGAQAVLQTLVSDSEREIPLRTSTIGGAIAVDGTYYAVTAAHVFPDVVEVSRSNEQNSEEESAYESVASDSSHDTIPPYNVEIGQRKRTQKRALIRLQSKVFAQHVSGDFLNYDDLSLPVQSFDEGMLINNRSSMVMLNRKEDWALIPIENDKFRVPNEFQDPSNTERGNVVVSGITDKMPTGTVTAVTGMSPIAKTNFLFQSLMLLPGADKMQVVWAADLDTAAGDCGSWLIDESGKASAMIIAASEDDGEAFCIPLAPLFESVCARLNATSRLSLDLGMGKYWPFQAFKTSKQEGEKKPDEHQSRSLLNSSSASNLESFNSKKKHGHTTASERKDDDPVFGQSDVSRNTTFNEEQVTETMRRISQHLQASEKRIIEAVFEGIEHRLRNVQHQAGTEDGAPPATEEEFNQQEATTGPDDVDGWGAWGTKKTKKKTQDLSTSIDIDSSQIPSKTIITKDEDSFGALARARHQLAMLKANLDFAERAQDLESASGLRYYAIPEVEMRIHNLRSKPQSTEHTTEDFPVHSNPPRTDKEKIVTQPPDTEPPKEGAPAAGADKKPTMGPILVYSAAPRSRRAEDDYDVDVRAARTNRDDYRELEYFREDHVRPPSTEVILRQESANRREGDERIRGKFDPVYLHPEHQETAKRRDRFDDPPIIGSRSRSRSKSRSNRRVTDEGNRTVIEKEPEELRRRYDDVKPLPASTKVPPRPPLRPKQGDGDVGQKEVRFHERYDEPYDERYDPRYVPRYDPWYDPRYSQLYDNPYDDRKFEPEVVTVHRNRDDPVLTRAREDRYIERPSRRRRTASPDKDRLTRRDGVDSSLAYTNESRELEWESRHETPREFHVRRSSPRRPVRDMKPRQIASSAARHPGHVDIDDIRRAPKGHDWTEELMTEEFKVIEYQLFAQDEIDTSLLDKFGITWTKDRTYISVPETQWTARERKMIMEMSKAGKKSQKPGLNTTIEKNRRSDEIPRDQLQQDMRSGQRSEEAHHRPETPRTNPQKRQRRKRNNASYTDGGNLEPSKTTTRKPQHALDATSNEMKPERGQHSGTRAEHTHQRWFSKDRFEHADTQQTEHLEDSVVNTDLTHLDHQAREDEIVAACRAEDLKFEGDLQELFWGQGLSVELCDQILALHSAKEEKVESFRKEQSAKLIKNRVPKPMQRRPTDILQPTVEDAGDSESGHERDHKAQLYNQDLYDDDSVTSDAEVRRQSGYRAADPTEFAGGEASSYPKSPSTDDAGEARWTVEEVD